MHENRNLLLFLIEINNMHRTRHILPIPWTCADGAAGAVFRDVRTSFAQQQQRCSFFLSFFDLSSLKTGPVRLLKYGLGILNTLQQLGTSKLSLSLPIMHKP